MSSSGSSGYDIAVVGMAGRFPGAADLTKFWHNLRNGVESVKFFTDEELLAAGESAAALQDPDYVKAQPVLAGFDQFDAGFFGFSPQDAAVMDPQQRVFLEVGWEALENAGHTAESFAGSIGVYATCGMNSYMMYNLVNNRRIMNTVGEWLVRHTGNDMNFLATRLSYLLNLSGPSMNVQTACSSALVSIHLACQSLLSGECDLALAGGATIVLPHNRGYVYKPGEILSPDGHCRPFDAKARGTLFGSGAAVVALRRLDDAVADGDQVLAVIKGSAVNNDGSSKVGYLAPSVDGQAKAITEALAVSGVEAESISYVEMHGTGTIVGDPIEVTALTQAWRQFTTKQGICAIGSLKSSIGHLGEAAGVVAFIKTVLALRNRELPPSVNYELPNPQIDFASSPFFVNTKLTPWAERDTPRRAGVTSLGAGGTNCHVIVEEAPPREASGRGRARQVLLLSARTASGLAMAAKNLAAYLRADSDRDLADVAFTLHAGRKPFAHRLAVVGREGAEAAAALDKESVATRPFIEPTDRPIAFLFPGQGAQFPNMGRDLYQSESVFRSEVDQCAEILKQQRGLAILPLIFSGAPADEAQRKLNQTEITQPALFTIEYALAKLWMSWGVVPKAMIGHSIGEYVAACLAGVFSLSDALSLVADRGALMQQVPNGAMLAVALSAAEVKQALERSPIGDRISVAAANAPSLSVVAGPPDAIAAFAAELKSAGSQGQLLQTSHAFHSAMMDPVLSTFAERVRRVSLHPPSMPYLSNLTGNWIKPEEATDPAYWPKHLRGTVRFSDGVAKLLEGGSPVLIEVGPGGTLGSLARQQPTRPAAVLHSLGRAGEEGTDLATALKSYGQLWTVGCSLDATKFYAGQQRQRVSLPSYPFERQRYWIDPDPVKPVEAAGAAPEGSPRFVASANSLDKKASIADWFLVPGWKKAPLHASAVAAGERDPNWLVFLDETGVGTSLVEWLRTHQDSTAPRQPLCLGVAAPGDLDTLALTPVERHEPESGEVEIRVATAALNFADVLKATGAFNDAPFGMECAGIVERVGPGVADLQVGDPVVAIGPESFRSYVNRDARLVTRKPQAMSFEEAVTLPAAFMTAWYALHHVGKLRRGEKVLIHAASGGVGLAAVQVATLLGAEIFATAGNDEKRAYLRSLGIRHVFESRSVGFAAEILRITGGAGVDVALNSLTGEFIPKTLSTLASGGRFLEIGKRELLTPAQIAALKPKPGVTYSPIDLTILLRDDPDAYGALLREVVDHAAAGRFHALRHKVFPSVDAASAFHLMLQTRHIGKLVLSFNPLPPKVFCVRAGAKFARDGEREFVIDPGRDADYTALLEALEAADAKIGHIAHLWSIAAESSTRSLDASLERHFFSLTWLGKALGARDWTQAIDLTVVSTGLQQIAGETQLEPAKALLLGPCRVLPREMPNISCRSVDIPPAGDGTWQRERIVAQLLAEMSSNSDERIVAYRGSDRWVRRYEEVRLDAPRANPPLRQGGVYLITGGLGGLGLELAEHLARSVRAKLVLIGRTALPDRAEWDGWVRAHDDRDPTAARIRKIQACEALGGQVQIAAADVTDGKRMRAVVNEARKRFGTIHGVIHAAGSLDDGLIQLKTSESARAVLAPKVAGTLILDEVMGDAPLDFFVLFSSVSSILGIQGQVDYSAANAFLDAFAEARNVRGPGQTVSIDWGAWQGAGMAARSVGEKRRASSNVSQPAPHHPWLERRREEGGEVVFTTSFNRSRQWVLGEHVLHGGDALIPGTGYLELARAALSEVEKAPAVEISRVFFQAPFMARSDETRELEIALRRKDQDWEFRIQSDSGAIVHVTGHIAAAASRAAPALDVAGISRRCDQREEKLDGFLRQDFMDFGPRWGNVREIRYGDKEALLTLELPHEFAADLETFALHPALLDMATGGAQGLLADGDSGKTIHFYVPFSYGKLALRTGFSRRLCSHVRRRSGTADVAIFDVTIADERGAVLVEISDFAMKRVIDRKVLASPSRTEPALGEPAAATLTRHIQRHGILPAEGAEAFERVLASGIMPRVTVSSIDLHAWMRRIDSDSAPKPAEPTAAGNKRLSGGKENGALADRDSVQRRLAGMYSQILGVDSVGPQDDFFALGGHSLLAVRLLARIEKEFGKPVPLPLLFERPTIEALASFLEGDQGAKPKQPSVIVPLNEGGTGQAFYCVHSVGGEVMSFRHLSRLLGTEQRFYGIQAPPELRNGEFPSSIEAMAQYYIDALTQFQPEGPYLLGGWSAGSIIALEMAHQLRASGREVALLVALDGAPFNTGAGTSLWNPLYYWKLLCNLPRWIADDLMVDFSASAFSRRIRNKLVSLGRKTNSAFRKKSDIRGHEVEGFLDTSYFTDAQVSFMKALFVACYAYAAKEYPGQVLLFAAQTQPLYHLLEVEAAWASIAPSLKVIPTRGTHESIVREPHVLPVAASLRRYLAAFRDGESPAASPAGNESLHETETV